MPVPEWAKPLNQAPAGLPEWAQPLQAETPAAEAPGFFQQVGDDYQRRAQNISDSIERRTDGSTARRMFEAPSTLALAAGQAAGLAGDVLGAGIGKAYKSLVPESTQQAISEGASAIGASRPGQIGLQGLQAASGAYGKFKEAYPDAALALEGGLNLGGAAVVSRGAQAGDKAIHAAGKEAFDIGRDVRRLATSPDLIDKKIELAVKHGYTRGVRPTVVGKGTQARQVKAAGKAQGAVQEIISRKNVLSLTDDAGEKITGAVPQNLRQFAEAIDQTKREIYQEYNSLAKAAGDKGITFNAAPIDKKLAEISADLKHNPQIRQYADDLRREIAELHGQAPEVIEARIADLNSSLQGFYDGRVGKAKAQVDASVAALMRDELDSGISSAMGPGYQALRSKYGALKSIEKEVNHRAVVHGRQNIKGLADFTDIFTGMEIVGGAASMLAGNPAGAKGVVSGLAGRRIKGWIKGKNNPDNIVRDMFAKTEDLMARKTPQPPQSRLGGQIMATKTDYDRLQHLQGQPIDPLRKFRE